MYPTYVPENRRTYPSIYTREAEVKKVDRMAALENARMAAHQAASCATPATAGQRADYRGAVAWAAISRAWSAYADSVPWEPPRCTDNACPKHGPMDVTLPSVAE